MLIINIITYLHWYLHSSATPSAQLRRSFSSVCGQSVASGSVWVGLAGPAGLAFYRLWTPTERQKSTGQSGQSGCRVWPTPTVVKLFWVNFLLAPKCMIWREASKFRGRCQHFAGKRENWREASKFRGKCESFAASVKVSREASSTATILTQLQQGHSVGVERGTWFLGKWECWPSGQGWPFIDVELRRSGKSQLWSNVWLVAKKLFLDSITVGQMHERLA
jgi:hypothetical protein